MAETWLQVLLLGVGLFVALSQWGCVWALYRLLLWAYRYQLPALEKLPARASSLELEVAWRELELERDQLRAEQQRYT